ncbi:hypothetical protein R2R70_12825 [Cobetia sp. SIMBA_158]|uniref:hypothetical protein n=1 Tax=Cobetia sp. SIMBA_158 TaxID=3081617 RepID=UPI00397FF679
MSNHSKLRADLLSAAEGAFWLVTTWSSFWLGFNGHPVRCLVPLILATIVVAATFLHRPWAITLSRYRARLSRTEMLWHVLVIPMTLAIPIWMLLESLFGRLTPSFQLVLVAALSISGWCVYLITIGIKRTFQRLRRRDSAAA